MREKTIYREAIKLFGEEVQKDILIEEMAELTKAIIKFRRKDSFDNLTNILEELVDVSIMLRQLEVLYTDQQLDHLMRKVKEDKLNRLEDKINNRKTLNSLENNGIY